MVLTLEQVDLDLKRSRVRPDPLAPSPIRTAVAEKNPVAHTDSSFFNLSASTFQSLDSKWTPDLNRRGSNLS